MQRDALRGHVSIGTSSRPDSVVVSPDGKRLYVASSGTGNVWTIDPGALRVTGRPVRLGQAPVVAAISPDGRSLYTTDAFIGGVRILDTRSGHHTGIGT